MGIKGLMPFLKKKGLSEEALRPITSAAFFDKRVGLDTAILLYQAVATSESPAAHLQLLANRAAYFMKLDATPVFVFDGVHPEEKRAEEDRRRQRREATEAKLSEAQTRLAAAPGDPELQDQVEKLRRQCVRVTSRHLEEAETFLRALGLPVVRAPGEAERCLAALQASGALHLAVSEDTDTLVSGARAWVRCFGDLSNGNLPPLERKACEVRLERVLIELGMSYDAFVNFSALCGCDFAPKLPKVGPVLAFRLAQEVDQQGGSADPWTLSPQSMERCVRAALEQKAVAAAVAADNRDPESWIEQYVRAKKLLAYDSSEAMPVVPERCAPDARSLWPFLKTYSDLAVPPELMERGINDDDDAAPKRKRARPAPIEVTGSEETDAKLPRSAGSKVRQPPSPEGTV